MKVYLLEAVVLVTVRTVPAVPVPIRHHCVLITEPAVDVGMGGLFPANTKIMDRCQIILKIIQQNLTQGNSIYNIQFSKMYKLQTFCDVCDLDFSEAPTDIKHAGFTIRTV